MFDRVLNKTMSYYVWELVFGKINSFFQKFIHPWGMFIAECYIFIGFVATELKKNSLYGTIIKFDCSASFDCIFYFLTVTYMKIDSYIFVHRSPFHTMMLQRC